MEATLKVLNELVESGVVERYAIGGAVGAIFWVEPFDTIDLDIFVLLPDRVPPLDPLREVVDHLALRGYGFEGPFALIEGVPVQFLPADEPTGLQREALEHAVVVDAQGPDNVSTSVLTPEYLIALALQVHRSKDYERVNRLLTEAAPNLERVADLVSRYALGPFWGVFVQRYPEFGQSLPGCWK